MNPLDKFKKFEEKAKEVLIHSPVNRKSQNRQWAEAFLDLYELTKTIDQWHRDECEENEKVRIVLDEFDTSDCWATEPLPDVAKNAVEEVRRLRQNK